MTANTADAAEAVAEAAEAAEAVAEAAEAVADAAAAEAAEEGAEDAAAAAETAHAAPHAESAHDDRVQLDHEQRITRAEDAIAGIAAAIAERPTFDEVRSMTPSYSDVVDTAAAVAEETAEHAAEEAVEEAAEELADEGEGEAAEAIEAHEPDVPPVTEDATPERRGIFKW